MTPGGGAKPRILFLARSLPFHGLGGMEAAAWDLARELAATGSEVEILTTDGLGTPDGVYEGVRVRFLDAPPGRYSAAWRRASINEGLKAADRSDVVLSVSAAGFELARALRPRRRRPVLIMQAHGTSWLELKTKLASNSPITWLKATRNIRGLALDFAYRNFDAVVSIGPAVTADMRAWPTCAILGRTPVHEISNGVDERFFAFSAADRIEVREKLGIPLDAPTLITTARLHPEKGVAQSLAAFLELRRTVPSAHYIVVGDGPERRALEDAAHAAGASEVAHFVGPQPRRAVAGHLSAADAFVFTTLRQEGLPLNLLEAFANGLPTALSAHVMAPHYPATGVQPHAHRDVAAVLRTLCNVSARGRPSTLPAQHSLAWSAREYERCFTKLIGPIVDQPDQ